MKRELNQTNYVIVTDYDNEHYLEEVYLLGWDHNTDWYATDIDSRDIMTPKGNIKKNHNGCLDVDSHTTAYVEETNVEYLKSVVKDAQIEGYDCTVCKIEKDSEGEWIVIPV